MKLTVFLCCVVHQKTLHFTSEVPSEEPYRFLTLTMRLLVVVPVLAEIIEASHSHSHF